MVREFFTAHAGLLGELAGVLVIIVFVIVVAGAAIARFDRASLEEGIYLAFITAFTVGFGDIAPKSRGARIVSVILAFLGSRVQQVHKGTAEHRSHQPHRVSLFCRSRHFI